MYFDSNLFCRWEIEEEDVVDLEEVPVDVAASVEAEVVVEALVAVSIENQKVHQALLKVTVVLSI